MATLVFALMLLSTIACGSTPPETRIFNIEIADMKSSLEKIKVNQDDIVTLNINSDVLGDFHIHGYNHHAELMPDKSSSLIFTAKATGIFVVKLHLFDDEHTTETTHSHDEKTHQSGEPSSIGNKHHTAESKDPVETEVKLLTIEVRPR